MPINANQSSRSSGNNSAAQAPPGALTRRQKSWSYWKSHYQLYLFLLPAVVFTFLFCYIPIYGIQIAFKDYMPLVGIWDSPWVGMKHFIRFFDSFYFWEIVSNTLLLSLESLVISFPLPILLALLLNQTPNRRFQKTVQTVTYAPYFISTVVLCGMMVVFLSPRAGMINKLLELFGGQAVNFLGAPQYFRPVYILSGLWQGTGWSAIIYLAALAGISPELHEAAVVDGASKWQRIVHIDIPGILPTAVILLILSMGSIMGIGFEKAYLLQTNLNTQTSEIISTYVYKVGLVNNQYSFSTAIGLFNSIINLLLLVLVNGVSRRVTETSLW